ncbi:MAG: hypothetical protein ABJB10_04985 [Mesorhizobium sp.]
MPNLDGGHYFLTVLAPIRVDTMIDPEIGRSRSHRQLLAQKLALMATGRQTAESPPDAWLSPFSRNTRNHFARFVIINGAAFNGRISGDALIATARGINPLAPQPVDRLGTPFLLFAADIDAQVEGDGALRTYTDELWATMKSDLTVIFGHCVGFDGVDSADGFHAYIKRCQIETTMPFNDYWPDGLDVKDKTLALGALKPAAIVAAGATLLWLAALLLHGVFAVFGVHNGFAQWIATAAAWGGVVVLLLIILALLTAWGLYRRIFRQGRTPFATAPGSDLPSVLKSLFVQQHFTRFAIEAQGLNDAALHARFGAFLGAVKPDDTAVLTQQAGEIRAPATEWAR